MDGMTRGSIKNIRDSWRGIRTNKRKKERKGLIKKKKKPRKEK